MSPEESSGADYGRGVPAPANGTLARGFAMAKIIASTPQRMALQSGSTTLILDKDAGKAVLRRKLLFWPLKPLETPLSDVSGVTVDAAVDRASGVEVCSTMLVQASGAAWALASRDKAEAESAAAAMRGFLGID
jgi:hypothetical protein